MLTAWAEAMAWPANQRAPDDQVFDTILKKGGWLARASFGWLPASYLRTMPAYYRGVVPVIDHDHGNVPGLLKHSEAKPVLRTLTLTLTLTLTPTPTLTWSLLSWAQARTLALTLAPTRHRS